MTSPTSTPRVLLFDLGGVLVRWEGLERMLELAGGALSAEELRRYWLTAPLAQDFERGHIDPAAFSRRFVEDLRLSVTPERFLGEWTKWITGPLPGAVELLDELEGRFVRGCLSNNNPIHWQIIRDDYGFGSRFERVYLSYEMGLAKPHREAYAFAIGDLGVPPAEIAFFDDNPECVEAAAACGLRAFEVHGVDDIRRVMAGF